MISNIMEKLEKEVLGFEKKCGVFMISDIEIKLFGNIRKLIIR